jgi:hypothetical protein
MEVMTLIDTRVMDLLGGTRVVQRRLNSKNLARTI